MKKSVLVCLMVGIEVTAIFASSARVDIPSSLSATLADTVEEDDVSIFVYDEYGVRQSGMTTTVEFTFPSDPGAWEVDHDVPFGYSSNLFEGKRGILSFDVTPLHKDKDDVVPTYISLETSNPDVKVVNDSEFVIDFRKGYKGEVSLGILNIAVRKPAGKILEAGEYTGSISVNLSTSN